MYRNCTSCLDALTSETMHCFSFPFLVFSPPINSVVSTLSTRKSNARRNATTRSYRCVLYNIGFRWLRRRTGRWTRAAGVPLLQRDMSTKSRFPPSHQQDAMAEALESHSTLRSPLTANVSQTPWCAVSILPQCRVTTDLIGNNVQVGLALS